MQLGCALYNAELPPSGIDAPSQYAAATASKNGIAPAADWWRSFASPELTALVERALEVNHDIGAAIARIQQADMATRIVGTSLIPSGGFTGTRVDSRTSGAGLDLDAKLPVSRQWQIGITASYEIDFWGKNAALVLAADRTALASRFNRDVVELTVVSGVINTYFAALAAKDRLRIAEQNLKLAEDLQSTIKQRLQSGTSTTIDLAQQDYLVSTQRVVVSQHRRVLHQNLIGLATLIGEIPQSYAVRGRTLRVVKLPNVAPGLPSELLLQRPDIREAEARLASGSANLASARVALLPSIQLTAQGGFAAALPRALITPEAAVFNVAANAIQPIFDAPRLLGQIELAKAVQVELLERYRQAIIVGLTDVERALATVRDTAIEERLTQQTAEAAQRGFRLSEDQRNAGSIDVTTSLNVQRTLFEAQDALVQIRLVRLQAIVSLYQALGGGWRADPLPPLTNKPFETLPATAIDPPVLELQE